DGPVGLSCQLFRVTPESATEVQPLVDGSGAVLVFNGRLDNRDELLAALRKNGDRTSKFKGPVPVFSDASSPDPAIVLAAYAAFGERFVQQLNGEFALGLFDPRRQRLFLAADPIGLRPLYYYRTEDTFLFAS